MIRKPYRQAGFTMVELLIAIALSMIVLGAVLGIFNSSRQSYVVQEDLAAMQQDIRVARAFLERDLRVAGRGLGDSFMFLGERVFAFTFDNGGGEGGSDKLQIRYVEEIGGCPSDSADPKCSELPVLHSKGTHPASSNRVDVYEEKKDKNDDTYIGWQDGCNCGDDFHAITKKKPLLGIITTPDGKKSDIILITKGAMKQKDSFILNNPKTKYDADGDGTDEEYENKLGNEYPDGSTIEFFHLDHWEDPAWEVVGTELRRNGQVVCEHVEDLQFAFGLDTDADGEVDYWVDGTNAGDLTGDGDLTDADKALVRAVRATVVGRTAMEHKDLVANARPAIEDQPAGAADHFRRRISTFTVEVRNMGL